MASPTPAVILMPYFLSKPMTEAMTTEAQSVSGMKPMRTSSFSGLSEPAAQAPDVPGMTLLISAAPVRGLIKKEDLALFKVTDDPAEVVRIILDYERRVGPPAMMPKAFA